MRPQDLTFTKEELDKCFGPKMSRKEYLDSLRRKAGDSIGSKRRAESNSIRIAKPARVNERIR